jgi:hypothetical protein
MNNTEQNILKMDSGLLIENLKKRGFIFGEINKKILYNIEKIYKKEGGNRLNIAANFNINNNLKQMITIFSVLDRYNINYIHYIIILSSIPNKKMYNLYRYIIVKWNSIISKINNNYNNSEQNLMQNLNKFKFKPLKQIKESKMLEEILRRFEEFVFLDGEKFPNIYILFLVNNIQEYLCPL